MSKNIIVFLIGCVCGTLIITASLAAISFDTATVGDTITDQDILETDFETEQPIPSGYNLTKEEKQAQFTFQIKTLRDNEITTISKNNKIHKSSYENCRNEGGTIDECHAKITEQLQRIRDSYIEDEIHRLKSIQEQKELEVLDYWKEFDASKVSLPTDVKE